MLVVDTLAAVAKRPEVVGEALAGGVQVQVLDLGVAGVAESVDDHRRHPGERSGRHDRRLVLEPEPQGQLALEHVEEVGVVVMDVEVGAVAAGREARPGRVQGVVVGEDLDPALGRVADELAASRVDHHRLVHTIVDCHWPKVLARRGRSLVWRAMRITAGVALLLSLIVLGATSASAQFGTAEPPSGARIANARVYQNHFLTAKGETPAEIGAALAQLRPTYVSAMLRYRAGQKVRPRELQAWQTIVAAVRAVSPEAKFSVELNALEYPTVAKLNQMMAGIRSAVDNDGWLFDFYTTAAKKNPKVTAAAVANAHANGEFLGGNAFGITSNPTIPANTDYIAVQDFGFDINLPAVKKLSKRVPVFFHLGNSPGFASSDGCQFIEGLSTKRRIAYVGKRAGQQAAYGFRFGYPVYFPECERNRNTRNPTIFAYEAPGDDPMMTAIDDLMNRFTPAPAATP